jgi:hypothetical protein
VGWWWAGSGGLGRAPSRMAMRRMPKSNCGGTRSGLGGVSELGGLVVGGF